MAKVLRIEPKCAKQVTHKECGAVIEYTDDEVEEKLRYEYGRDSSVYCYLKCPNCGVTFSWPR